MSDRLGEVIAVEETDEGVIFTVRFDSEEKLQEARRIYDAIENFLMFGDPQP